MWVMMEKGIENGQRFSRFSAKNDFDDVKFYLGKRMEYFYNRGYTVTPQEDVEGYHVESETASFDILAYETVPVKEDKTISSAFYHYRDEFYYEVTHDDRAGIAFVYLYDRKHPEWKRRLVHTKNYSSDEEAVAIAAFQVEDAIEAMSHLYDES